MIHKIAGLPVYWVFRLPVKFDLRLDFSVLDFMYVEKFWKLDHDFMYFSRFSAVHAQKRPEYWFTFDLVSRTFHQHAKFEVCIFSSSRDITGVPQFEK